MEPGYVCTGGNTIKPDKCTDKCGDGYVVVRPNDNYCDDGNILNGDGCTANCQIESGFTCSGGSPSGPDVCHEICGDGKHMGALQCDDGNTKDGDGCSHDCQIEPGWVCDSGTINKPDVCRDKCGDGYVFLRPTATYCDDGNNVNGDGCNSNCQIENGF